VRILFTGASSFTGMWFVRALAQAGHEVTATFRKRPEEYAEPIRRQRAVLAARETKPVYGCSFGDEQFVTLAGQTDMLCHHAADVTNYRSPDFDVTAAVANNTRNIRAVCAALKSAKARMLVTGSIFEQGEGAGSSGLRAFSPYGLSKGLTWEMLAYYAEEAKVPVGKFVIPNPFGAFEEPRFTAYLFKCWFGGQAAAVNTPDYLRDNVHVSLLAAGYRQFVENLGVSDQPMVRLNPSGYTETQGAFALRVAAEMRKRLGLACEVDLKKQDAFPEPRVRINTDALDATELRWDEAGAWDAMANFYQQQFGK